MSSFRIRDLVKVEDAALTCDITQGFHQVQSSNPSLTQKLKRLGQEKQVLLKELKKITSKAYKRQLVLETLQESYSLSQARRILNRNVKFVRQYDKDDVTKALVLKVASNKAYNFLRASKLVALPSQRTLSRWLQDFQCIPGIQHDCLKIVKEKLQQSNVPYEKLVSSSFDEMELRKKYEYHATTLVKALELLFKLKIKADAPAGSDIGSRRTYGKFLSERIVIPTATNC